MCESGQRQFSPNVWSVKCIRSCPRSRRAEETDSFKTTTTYLLEKKQEQKIIYTTIEQINGLTGSVLLHMKNELLLAELLLVEINVIIW